MHFWDDIDLKLYIYADIFFYLAALNSSFYFLFSLFFAEPNSTLIAANSEWYIKDLGP